MKCASEEWVELTQHKALINMPIWLTVHAHYVSNLVEAPIKIVHVSLRI